MNWTSIFGGRHAARGRSADTGSEPGAGAHDAGGAYGAYSSAAYAALTGGPNPIPPHGPERAGPGAGLTVEKRSSEIIAWRGWLLTWERTLSRQAHLLLRSTATRQAWSAPQLKVAPPVPEDRIKTDDYSFMVPLPSEFRRPVDGYGIHACKPEHFTEMAYHGLPVIGQVALSGRVIEHEYGYRAERAMIRRLWLRADGLVAIEGVDDVRPLDLLPELAERYGCEVDFITTETPWV